MKEEQKASTEDEEGEPSPRSLDLKSSESQDVKAEGALKAEDKKSPNASPSELTTHIPSEASAPTTAQPCDVSIFQEEESAMDYSESQDVKMEDTVEPDEPAVASATAHPSKAIRSQEDEITPTDLVRVFPFAADTLSLF